MSDRSQTTLRAWMAGIATAAVALALHSPDQVRKIPPMAAEPTPDDGYPTDWNRVYERGALMRAFPPIEELGFVFKGNRFYDCDLSGLEI